jgi:hypothetical protein
MPKLMTTICGSWHCKLPIFDDIFGRNEPTISGRAVERVTEEIEQLAHGNGTESNGRWKCPRSKEIWLVLPKASRRHPKLDVFCGARSMTRARVAQQDRGSIFAFNRCFLQMEWRRPILVEQI